MFYPVNSQNSWSSTSLNTCIHALLWLILISEISRISKQTAFTLPMCYRFLLWTARTALLLLIVIFWNVSDALKLDTYVSPVNSQNSWSTTSPSTWSTALSGVCLVMENWRSDRTWETSYEESPPSLCLVPPMSPSLTMRYRKNFHTSKACLDSTFCLCTIYWCWILFVFNISANHIWRMAAMAKPSSPSGGGDSQSCLPWCGYPNHWHSAPWSSVVHLACRTQALSSVWPPRLRKNHDLVQCP